MAEKEFWEKYVASLYMDAYVDVLTSAQGGRRGPFATDYRPDAWFGDMRDGVPLVLGVHVYLLDDDLLWPGSRGRVRIIPWYPEYCPILEEGSRFVLCEGRMVVGVVTVTRPLPRPNVIIDTDPPIDPMPSFAGDSAPLVYFLSFAFSGRYGSQHALTKAALRLRTGGHKIDLKPLLTFADRDAEDEADRLELDRVWQDAAPLAECCRRVVEAIDADAAVREQLAEFPALRLLIDELGRIASEAAARGARIRVTYAME